MKKLSDYRYNNLEVEKDSVIVIECINCSHFKDRDFTEDELNGIIETPCEECGSPEYLSTTAFEDMKCSNYEECGNIFKPFDEVWVDKVPEDDLLVLCRECYIKNNR